MELHSVPVFKGRGFPYPDFMRNKAAYSDKSFFEYFGFGFNLGFIFYMLEGAASAATVMGAYWLGSLWGWPQDFQKFCLGPGFILFRYPAPDQVSGRCQFYKNALAVIRSNTRSSGGTPFHSGAKDFASCHYYFQYTIIA
jgi:hypothetical protein